MAPVVYSFDEHPRKVLTGTCPPLLTTMSERERLIEPYAEVKFLDFAAVQPLSADLFLSFLAENQKVRCLLMGFNHRFGSDGGLLTDNDYESLAAQHSITIIRAQALTLPDGTQPSSTLIREALLHGEMQRANKLLGYYYNLSGVVTHGQGLGRTIGFPTANIDYPTEKLLPQTGVYIGRAEGRCCLVNVGTNPTVGGKTVTIEVHIPNFSGDLYGQRLTVTFEQFLRPEQQFPSLHDLREQIRRDLLKLSDVNRTFQ